MKKTTLLDFIKGLDYKGVEDALSPRWDCAKYSEELVKYYQKETELAVFDSEEDLIDRLASSFAEDYARNSPFLKEYNFGEEMIVAKTPEGQRVIGYPCILPHPKMEMDGIVIPFYGKIYTIYFNNMDYLELASVKNFIWNLCIDKTLFKLQKLTRYKLSVNKTTTLCIQSIMVEDEFGSLNNCDDLCLYIKRNYGRLSVLSEGFVNNVHKVESSINNIPISLIPKQIDLDIIIKGQSRPAKLPHLVYVNTDKSISLVPKQNILIEILEKQILYCAEIIDDSYLILPKEFYEILSFLQKNEIKMAFGYIRKVRDTKETIAFAKENHDFWKKEIGKQIELEPYGPSLDKYFCYDEYKEISFWENIMEDGSLIISTIDK